MSQLAKPRTRGLGVWKRVAAPAIPPDPRPRSAVHPYDVWIAQNEPSADDLLAQRQVRLAREPRISIIVPTYQTPIAFLAAMIASVWHQTYPHWQLCIVDGGSHDPALTRLLQDWDDRDDRIDLRFLPRNLGIVGNSNAAAALAVGDYIAFLDHDDLLAPNALFEIARAVNEHPEADFLYTDEDAVDEAGQTRSNPNFKPEWAPDNLRSHNYITHLAVYRSELFTRLGGYRAGYEGSQDYDLILRATELARRVVHIPKVLYHWRVHAGSCASGEGVKTYAYDAARKAIRAHLVRSNLDGEVADGVTHGIYRVTYRLPRQPLVSILIPNRDQPDMLERCVDSIERSTYANHEIVIVENDSRLAQTHELYARLTSSGKVRILPWDRPFNYSAVNNFAAASARGEVLLLLNNDVEAINPDWLERMLEHALRPEVGLVGAKLYYGDDTLQHGGVIVGLGGAAAHSHTRYPRSSFGYQGRLIVTQNLSAVTAACLMVRKDVYDEAGGLDEGYAIAFNDVDFCLRVRQRGRLVVWTPHAELYHHESRTRGTDDTPEKQARFQQEIARFKTRWVDLIRHGDPYYSPNLTDGAEDFSYRFR
jgi:GT2 family glycosyltransferase